MTEEEDTSAVGCETTIVVVVLHRLSSVIVYVYVPAITEKVPVPIKGAVPPDAETVTSAEPPLQIIGVVITDVAERTPGSVIVIVVVAVHPLLSVIV